MKRAFLVALTLSATAALAACDNNDDTVSNATPAADGSVTMPSPAPQTTPPSAGTTTGGMSGTGTTGTTGTPGSTGTTQ